MRFLQVQQSAALFSLFHSPSALFHFAAQHTSTHKATLSHLVRDAAIAGHTSASLQTHSGGRYVKTSVSAGASQHAVTSSRWLSCTKKLEPKRPASAGESTCTWLGPSCQSQSPVCVQVNEGSTCWLGVCFGHQIAARAAPQRARRNFAAEAHAEHARLASLVRGAQQRPQQRLQPLRAVKQRVGHGDLLPRLGLVRRRCRTRHYERFEARQLRQGWQSACAQRASDTLP